MSPLSIISLGLEDVVALAQLEAMCFSTPWREEDFYAAMAQNHFTAFGIKDQGMLVAYISLLCLGSEAEILNLATLAARRREGLARQVLTHALQWLASIDHMQVFLEVREHNQAARALYTAQGFSQVGIRRHYYQDTGEDALVLCKDLGKLQV